MIKNTNKTKIFIVLLCFFFLCLIVLSFIKFKKSNIIPMSNTVIIESIRESNIDLELTLSPNVDLSYYREYFHNPDIIARLEIPNLLNIFITKAENNEFYLNHSITKKKNTIGTEFMDYRNSLTSKQINIYGHNSRTYNTEFRKLENYLEEDFFNNNPYIILQCDNIRRIYKILAIKEVYKDYEHMKIELEGSKFIKHIDHLKKDSLYQRDIIYNEDSNIIILQTCSYNNQDAYYIIIAVEI